MSYKITFKGALTFKVYIDFLIFKVVKSTQVIPVNWTFPIKSNGVTLDIPISGTPMTASVAFDGKNGYLSLKYAGFEVYTIPLTSDLFEGVTKPVPVKITPYKGVTLEGNLNFVTVGD